MLLKRKNKTPLLAMAGKLCVFLRVHNVYAADLALLRTPKMHGTHTMLNWITNLWKRLKGVNGNYPPQGWPTSVITFFIVGCIMCIQFGKAIIGSENVRRDQTSY